MTQTARYGSLRLDWADTNYETRSYVLYGIQEDGQIAWLADTEQGPFDTALEIAQWLTRQVARALASPMR